MSHNVQTHFRRPVGLVIGWHFLYEGWVNLIAPSWSAAGYLKSATGPLSRFFDWRGSTDWLVRIVDPLNVWGLLLVGLGLMLGIAVRPAALSGMALLLLYYLSYPPLFGPTSGGGDGQYLIVSNNLIEMVALAVVYANPSAAWGLSALLSRRTGISSKEQEEPRKAAPSLLPAMPGFESRRRLMQAAVGLPVLGAAALAILKRHGWRSFEEANLRTWRRPTDVYTASASTRSFQIASVRDLKGELPRGRIGNVSLSRVILGGNLMGGWAHARDLIYVSSLVLAYHTRRKIFQTLDLAEACGVNTLLTNPMLCGVVNDYWRCGGKIQFISDCGGDDILAMIQKSIDQGACACYIQGGVADALVEKGEFDLIAKGLDLIRRNRMSAGIGGHKLTTVHSCIEKGLIPDFWMKTFHPVNYWSARIKPGHDNCWCEDPIATAAYMRGRPEPWIAFKVLDAGAIEPEVGFKHAFENGVDFICVGMYDFQIVQDVILALDVLSARLNRSREWRA